MTTLFVRPSGELVDLDALAGVTFDVLELAREISGRPTVDEEVERLVALSRSDGKRTHTDDCEVSQILRRHPEHFQKD